MDKKTVAVVMGGISMERDVSLSSGTGALAALKEAGYNAYAIDIRDNPLEFIHQLSASPPDVIFNALHGTWGEDGCIQGIFEYLNIPYTHSGVLASSIAMNKVMSRSFFMQSGIPVAPGAVALWHEAQKPQAFFPYPYVVKPINEGSSVGVYVVHDADTLPPRHAFADHQDVLIEQYIPGREIQVTVVGDTRTHAVKAWGAIEICPKQGFYDYRAKYTPGYADHLMPAPLPETAYERALSLAARAHTALNCRGITRVDLRYDDTRLQAPDEMGDFYVLEINTQPGLTPLSLVPETLAHYGWSYTQVVSWLVDNAALDSIDHNRYNFQNSNSITCAK
jgi:D-alanine-D-alanine ligase